ncbi:MAG: NAD(P)H-hydrate dehydratase [Oligoflexia bacterium]|nr:NAD(P)H-hydrate dehydratase [Oligoflexia bacterium]
MGEFLKPILTIGEMREFEALASLSFNLREDLIIENVGLEAALLLEKLVHSPNAKFVILSGKGNNGADGVALARQLFIRGHQVEILYLFPEQEFSSELLRVASMARAYGVASRTITSKEQLRERAQSAIIVDAICGTGFKAPFTPFLREMVLTANEVAQLIIAMDIPSGVEGNSGYVAEVAINADYTFAIGAGKPAYFFSKGVLCKGKVLYLYAGFPHCSSRMEVVTHRKLCLQHFFKKYPRSERAHKNSFGHALVVGGSLGFTGALALAARAAYSVGAGLTTAVSEEDAYEEFLLRAPAEVMCGKHSSISAVANNYQAILVGPGLVGDKSEALLCKLLGKEIAYGHPLLLDAGALTPKLLPRLKERTAPTILTPHIGEWVRLLGISKSEFEADRLGVMKKFLEDFKTQELIVILKDSCTTILNTKNSKIIFHDYPNSALAKGGSGDVLAGVLLGLCSVAVMGKAEISEVVLAATALHSLAAKVASQKLSSHGVMASDLIDALTTVIRKISN